MQSEPRTAPAVRSELKTRVASSLVLVPIALAAGFAGGLPFACLVILVALLALWEWTGVTGAARPAWARVGMLLCLAAGLLALALSRPAWAAGFIGVPALMALAAGYRLRSLLWMGLGLIYVAVPGAAFIILREAQPFGWAAVLFLLVVVWATDIGAYFGGRRIGGPKLWPRVSPKKTWSGAVSGVAAAIFAGVATVWFTRAGGAAAGLLLAIPLSIASQAGDLLESAMKRRFGVKDSGRLIPGHGGVLDRVDGLFAAAALAWLIAATGLGGSLLALPQQPAAALGTPS